MIFDLFFGIVFGAEVQPSIKKPLPV